MTARALHILGAPLDLGAGRRGVDMGPSALPLTHLGPRLQELGYQVVDRGNGDVANAEAAGAGDPRCRCLDPVTATCRQIHDHVPRSVERGAVPLSIGIRSLDAGEPEIVRRVGIKTCTMADSDRRSMSDIIAGVPDRVLHGTAGVQVSLDADGLDPEIGPGVGTPVRGGLSYGETQLATEMVIETGKSVGFDLVEVNPILDAHSTTAELGCERVLSHFDKRIP